MQRLLRATGSEVVVASWKTVGSSCVSCAMSVEPSAFSTSCRWLEAALRSFACCSALPLRLTVPRDLPVHGARVLQHGDEERDVAHERLLVLLQHPEEAHEEADGVAVLLVGVAHREGEELLHNVAAGADELLLGLDVDLVGGDASVEGGEDGEQRVQEKHVVRVLRLQSASHSPHDPHIDRIALIIVTLYTFVSAATTFRISSR